MLQLEPPIHYFGYRKEVLAPLFTLFSKKQYERSIDVFSGSGSFSLYAMSRKKPFAATYHLNDRFKPCIAFLKGLKTSSKKVIEKYTTLLDASNTSDNPTAYYATHVSTYNQGNDETKMLLLPYLSNCTFQGELRFNKAQQLISTYTDNPTAVTCLTFTTRCQALEKLFKQSEMTFSDDDFVDFIDNLSPNTQDFVMLDPPYPDDYVDDIYQKFESKIAFHQKLQRCVNKLIDAHIDFVLYYGAFTFSKTFFIQNACHFVRLSGSPAENSGDMGEYLEHVYFPPHLLSTVDFQANGFYHYEGFEGLNNEETLASMQSKQAGWV